MCGYVAEYVGVEKMTDDIKKQQLQLSRSRALPPPRRRRLASATMAEVTISMMMPSTEIAARSPLSLRSKISTEITLVSEVNSMTAADSSRMVPTNTKHQVAITEVRSSGAVISRSARSRVAPRIRLASSSSGWIALNADCIC